MKKILGKGIAIFVLSIGGGILGSQILWPYLVERPLFFRYRLWEIQRPIIEKKEIIVTEDEEIQKIIPDLKKEIVLVRIKTNAGEIVRTGTVITSDGVVAILSQDIPKNFQTIEIEEDSFSSPAKIFKQDKNITLLKAEKGSFSPVSLAPKEKISLGEKVFSLTENQEEDGKTYSINVGFITKISPEIISTSMMGEKEENSSPLFNLQGKLLGIIFLDKNGKVKAIPVSEIQKTLNLNA